MPSKDLFAFGVFQRYCKCAKSKQFVKLCERWWRFQGNNTSLVGILIVNVARYGSSPFIFFGNQIEKNGYLPLMS